jgi:hypothetical protein
MLPASDLSNGALGSPHLRIFGRHFIDGHGRIVQLRGANVSGSSKLCVVETDERLSLIALTSACILTAPQNLTDSSI